LARFNAPLEFLTGFTQTFISFELQEISEKVQKSLIKRAQNSF